jgi:hypothetical protein
MTRRKPNHQRQVEAALRFWEQSLKPFSRKERNYEDETQDRRTADDAAACPQRQGEDEGDDEGREGQTHLGEGE